MTALFIPHAALLAATEHGFGLLLVACREDPRLSDLAVQALVPTVFGEAWRRRARIVLGTQQHVLELAELPLRWVRMILEVEIQPILTAIRDPTIAMVPPPSELLRTETQVNDFGLSGVDTAPVVDHGNTNPTVGRVPEGALDFSPAPPSIRRCSCDSSAN